MQNRHANVIACYANVIATVCQVLCVRPVVGCVLQAGKELARARGGGDRSAQCGAGGACAEGCGSAMTGGNSSLVLST
jgi:hypothetical protein